MTRPTVSKALSDEEWAEFLAMDETERFFFAKEVFGANEATAACALLDQPFGFHHNDVDTLRSLADSGLDRDMSIKGDALTLRSIADRIEALLPPRGSHE